jgi:hypothetical protein
MRFDQDALEGQVIFWLLEQSQSPGGAIPDVVNISAGTLSGASGHGFIIPRSMGVRQA